MKDVPQAAAKPDSFYRAMGLGVLGLGALLGKFFVLDVLAAARLGGEVRIFTKAVVMTGFLAMMGLVMIVFGAKSMAHMKIDKKKLTVVQVIFLLAGVAVGFGLLFWMQDQLREMGFSL